MGSKNKSGSFSSKSFSISLLGAGGGEEKAREAVKSNFGKRAPG